jgi:hypothetical protein
VSTLSPTLPVEKVGLVRRNMVDTANALCLYLDLPGQSGDRQLDDHPGELGAIAPAMAVFARSQCPGDVRGILLGHVVRADEAGMSAAGRG